MTKSEYLFEKLDELQEQITDNYYKTLNELTQQFVDSPDPDLNFPIEIVTEEQQDNQEFDLIVDITDEVNGGIYSVYVLMLNSFGEFIGLSLDSREKDTYNLNDISNEYNKIEMIQLLEKYLKQ